MERPELALSNAVLPQPQWVDFAAYLQAPHAWVAVFLPMTISIVVLIRARAFSTDFATLRLVFWLSLPIMYLTAFWRENDGVLSLHILAIFSAACMYMVWRRMTVTAGLAYALTFFSLFWVDLARAFEFALRDGVPMRTFYYGIGGAGLLDGLFVFPLLTAIAVRYAHWRQSQSTIWTNHSLVPRRQDA